MDLAGIQTALRTERLDAWLLYDFRGTNPIATRLAGVGGPGVMTTRRWFYLVPADGSPRGLVHAIERHNLDHLPGDKLVYADRHELDAGLRALVAGRSRVAMEYAAGGANPYVSRVDAGTVDQIRGLGVEVVSSGDLAQQFEAGWTAGALASHREAADILYRVKDAAFDELARRLRDGQPPTELDVQRHVARLLEEADLVFESGPVVAAREHSGDPHYTATESGCRTIARDDVVLIDLWAKRPQAGSVYADITWMAYAGPTPPDAVVQAFATVRAARDAALEVVRSAARRGGDLRGWQVDRAARDVIDAAGLGTRFVHRTGHSLGESVHGNGVHMDDYETRDERRLRPGAGFTIEPGVYFEAFGVRTEINVFYGEHEALATGPLQTEIVTLMD